MSVHNAIGALFSIARKDPGSYTAIASGPETVEAAFCEAIGMLADGATAVMVVYYEEPLPVPFQHFEQGDQFPHAWACRLVPAISGGISLIARSAAQNPGAEGERSAPELACHDPALGADLNTLRFLTSNQASHTYCVGNRCWQWSRHA
jgi:hypothetical protein